jgi:hypothetical protein
VSKNTVRDYLKLAADHHADLSVVLKLPTEDLRQVLYPDKVRPMVDRKAVFDAKIEGWIKELTRVGVNKQLLYEEYKREHPDGYGSSQFYVHLAREIGRRDLTLPLSHKPGEKLQLDFAGKTFPWVDRETGEVHKAQVLIGVMPHSQHTFATAVYSGQSVCRLQLKSVPPFQPKVYHPNMISKLVIICYLPAERPASPVFP